MNTIELLKNYTALQASVENLTRRLEHRPLPQTRQALERTQYWLDQLERSLNALTEEERQVLDMLFIRPEKGNTAKLCELLQVEQSSIYRRRDRALSKLNLALNGLPDT